MSEQLVVREARDSKYYLEHGMSDLFQNLDVRVNVKEEELFDNIVTVVVDDEVYEIRPFSNKRVKIIHRFEQVEPMDEIDSYPPVTQIPAPKGDLGDFNIIGQINSPENRALAERAVKILNYERVTRDPRIWEAVEFAREEPQRIVITLPRGTRMTRADQDKVTKMLKLIEAGNFKLALREFTNLNLIRTDTDVEPDLKRPWYRFWSPRTDN